MAKKKTTKSAAKKRSTSSKATQKRKRATRVKSGHTATRERHAILKSFSDSSMSKSFDLATGDKPTQESLKIAGECIFDLILSNTPTEPDLQNKLLFVLSLKNSVSHLPGYATLDPKHVEQIRSFIESMVEYVDDDSRERPLNFLMLASPGAGKSHFIKCVAKTLTEKKIKAIDFNMATIQTNDDLVPALDAARNAKVDASLPLLFLDEFDSADRNYPLLLPLLWDGELNLGQRNLRIGKSIIVMAGSDPKLPLVMEHARSMQRELPSTPGMSTKVTDLCSRINGTVLELPKFFDPSNDIDRRSDKVCIAVQLLKNRFGDTLSHVPIALLRFIGRVEFRYNVRSIAHLIEEISYRPDIKTLQLQDIDLALNSTTELEHSSLAYHLLHHHQSHGIVDEWADCGKFKHTIPIKTDAQNRFSFSGKLPEEIAEWYVANIATELNAT